MAEAEALDELLVRLVVELGELLLLRRVVRGAEPFVLLGYPAHCGEERAKSTADTDLSFGRGQDEARFAALAGVLDEGGSFGSHRRSGPSRNAGSMEALKTEVIVTRRSYLLERVAMGQR